MTQNASEQAIGLSYLLSPIAFFKAHRQKCLPVYADYGGSPPPEQGIILLIPNICFTPPENFHVFHFSIRND
jgi:hypothetical protein